MASSLKYPTNANSWAVAPDEDTSQLAWVNPTNVYSDDASYADVSVPQFDTNTISQRLRTNTYGYTFSAGTTITGIKVEIENYCGAGGAVDFRVQLIGADGNLVGDNKGDTVTAWDGSPTIHTYGGESDMWNTSLTYSDVNDTDFGVCISAKATADNTDIYIDYVRITVYYSTSPLQITPTFVNCLANVIQPTVVCGSLSLSPTFTNAFANVVAPTVYAPCMLSPPFASCLANVTQPTVRFNLAIMQTVVFGGINQATSRASDGTYLYVGLYTSPVQVLKISLATNLVVDSWTGDTNENQSLGMDYANGYLYVGINTDPSTGKSSVVKLDVSDMSETATYTLPSTYRPRGVHCFGSYVYVGDNASPDGHVYKLAISNLALSNTWTSVDSVDLLYGVTDDGTYIYAGGQGSVPAKVAQIDVSDMSKHGLWTGDFATYGEQKVDAVYLIGGYLYAGLDTMDTATRIVKIDTSTMTTSLRWTLDVDYAFTLDYISPSLYVGMETPATYPAGVYVLDPSDLSLVEYEQVSSGGQHWMMVIGDYVYFSRYVAPLTIYKVGYEAPQGIVINPSPAQALTSVIAPTVVISDLFITPTFASCLANVVQPTVVIPIDVTIDDSVGGNILVFGFHGGIFWKSKLVGYVIYLDSNNYLVYRKTTNGGATWGDAQTIYNEETARFYDCYADWQTPGSSGTKIHIVFNSGGEYGGLYYINLDTSTDTLSSRYDFYDSGQGSNSSRTAFHFSICKSRYGNLYTAMRWQDYSETYHYDTYVSDNDGSSWSSVDCCVEAATNDYFILLPGDETDPDDIWCFYWDYSTDEISLKTYDSSLDSWSEQSIASGYDPQGGTYLNFDAQIRHSDGHMIVAIWNDAFLATDDLKVWDINGASSITAKTDVMSDASAETILSSVFIDQNNDDIYVAYVTGTAFLATVKVYYRKSTDGGTTWSSQQTMQNNDEDDERWISSGGMSPFLGGRFEPIWFNDDLEDLFCNFDNSIAIEAGLTITPAFSSCIASVIQPTVIEGGGVLVEPAFVGCLTNVIAPTVVYGSLTLSPTFVNALANVVQPTVVSGSITVTPTFTSAIASVIQPTVVISALEVTPTFAGCLANVIAPTVLTMPDVDKWADPGQLTWFSARLYGEVIDDQGGEDIEVQFRYKKSSEGEGSWVETSWDNDEEYYYHEGDYIRTPIYNLDGDTQYDAQVHGRYYLTGYGYVTGNWTATFNFTTLEDFDVLTNAVTDITGTTAKANGQITAVPTSAAIRGFEPVAEYVAHSGRIRDAHTCDGMCYYNGYLFIVSRSGTDYQLHKIDISDLSVVNKKALYGGGDAILAVGGYIWVGFLDGGCYQIDPSDLSYTTKSFTVDGRGVYSIATDGTYIYAGTGDGGYIYKYNISTESKSNSAVIDTGYDGHVHNLAYYGGYLYGCVNDSTPPMTFKVDASDLSIDDTESQSNDAHDDIVADASYFYTIGANGFRRHAVSDLSSSVVSLTEAPSFDGLDSVDGKLLASRGISEDYTYLGINKVFSVNQSAWTEYNRLYLTCDNYQESNELLVVGDYVYILRYYGMAPEVWIEKYNKSDIMSNLIFTSESGTFGTGSFQHNLSNLTPNTQYKLVAYARETGKSNGYYSYGSIVTFITDEEVEPTFAGCLSNTVAPTIILGSITITPSPASCLAQVAQPTVLGGGLQIEPEYTKALANVVAPTVILGSTTAAPTYSGCLTSVVQPAVILGNLTLQPTYVSIITSVIQPSVLAGDIVMTPAFASALAQVIQPTVSTGSLIVTPTYVSALCQTVTPTVVLGSVSVSPTFVQALTQVIQPTVVVGGNIIISPEYTTCLTSVVAPFIVLGSVTALPTWVQVIASVVQPTVVMGDIVLTPTFVRAITSVEQPVVTIPGELVQLELYLQTYHDVEIFTETYHDVKIWTGEYNMTRRRDWQRGETVPIWAECKLVSTGALYDPDQGVTLTVTCKESGVVVVNGLAMTKDSVGMYVYYYNTDTDNVISWYKCDGKAQDGSGDSAKVTIEHGGFNLQE